MVTTRTVPQILSSSYFSHQLSHSWHVHNVNRGNFVSACCLVYSKRHTCHYTTLGLKQTATNREIKDAYVKLSKKYHPDSKSGHMGTASLFQNVTEAYKVLGKPSARKEYDDLRRAHHLYNGGYMSHGTRSRARPGSSSTGQQNSSFSGENSDINEEELRRMMEDLFGGKKSADCRSGAFVSFEAFLNEKIKKSEATNAFRFSHSASTRPNWHQPTDFKWSKIIIPDSTWKENVGFMFLAPLLWQSTYFLIILVFVGGYAFEKWRQNSNSVSIYDMKITGEG